MNLRQVTLKTSCLLLLHALLFTGPARAATQTWIGLGPDANWADSTNWSTGAPNNNDLVIFSGSVRPNNTDNISNLTLGWMQFNNGGFNLNGNLLTLNPSTTGVITNLGGTNIVTLPLSLTPAGKWWSVAANSELRLAGAFTNTAVTGTTTGWMFLTNAGTVRIMNLAQSTRGLDLFQGTVIVDGGWFDANNDGIRFKPGTGLTASVIITNNGTVRIGGGGNFRMGTLNGTYGAATAGSLSQATISSGALELYGSAACIEVGDTVAGAAGIFNQNGGTVWGSYSVSNVVGGNALIIGNSVNATGTYNLNGGLLWIGQIYQVSGATNTVFNFNGGTLKAIVNSTTFFQGLTAANVQSGGAIIDTTNVNITIGQSLLASGAGGLIKLGTGNLVLSGTNTYAGLTTVSNGALVITGSLSGSGAVTVAYGTLAGSGAIAGPVSVLAGGTLSPGAASAAPQTLSLNNSLTLSGNLTVQVNKSVSPSNDMTVVNGVLTNAGSGTLTVVNSGPAFAAGDVFQLFSKPLPNGGALTISPATPGLGLIWSNNLAANGTLAVASTSAGNTAAELSSLTISTPSTNWPLTPSFASNVPTYTTSLPYTNTSITVTPVSYAGNATILVICNGVTNSVASGSPSSPIPLNPGSNTVSVNVTAQNGAAVANYFVNVTRTPPNIVLILADDQGFSDWSCYGSEIQTPNLDRLARGGLRFRNFFNAARCSPTRCAILTGLYTQQAAVDPSASLPTLRTDNNITIAELLVANGYRAYMSGKWHLGAGTGQEPWQRGFQEVFTYISGTDDHEDEWTPSDYTFVSTDGRATNITYAAGQFYQPNVIGDYCMEFLSNHFNQYTNTPFFLYVPFGSAHYDLQAPQTMVDTNVALYTNGWDVVRNQRYANMLAQGVIDPRYALSPNEGTGYWSDGPVAPEAIPAWNTLNSTRQADLTRRMAVYASMVQAMDANVGRIVQRLQQQGQLNNTLIIALSDNGGNFEGGVYGQTAGVNDGNPLTGTNLENMGLSGQPYVWLGGGWAHVNNTPFRLFKHYDHNGGIATPCIINWPQVLSRTNQWDNQVGHIIDVMATIRDVTGASYPTQFNGHAVWPMQGQSLKPLFTNSLSDFPRTLGFEHEGNRAYISNNWKFVTKNFTSFDNSTYANELELYDLSKDPSETTNLAWEDVDVLGQMVTNWNNWCTYVGDASSLLLTSATNSPQTLPPDPALTTNDLFVDTFDRQDDTDIDASAQGMGGSYVPPMGVEAAYYQGYEGSGLPTSMEIADDTLWMAVGEGMSENGIMYNFVGQDIINAGGFSIELNVEDINDDGTDTGNKYVGFGVGLTAAQAVTGGDVSDPLTPGTVAFRGEVGGNTGACAFFVELDEDGNVTVWQNGALLDSIPVGQNTGVLTASFACAGFTTNDIVTVTVFLNGQLVNINPGSTNSVSRTFTWNQNDNNYIGLSARAANYAQMDNLAIRKLPLAGDLAVDYAMNYGLTGTNAALNADPDGDGVSNFGEWAFGGNPIVPDSYIAGFQSIEVLPGNDFLFTFQRYSNYELVGLQYHYLTSVDLIHWTEVTPNIVSVSPNEDKPGYDVVTLGLPSSVTANQSKLFLKIRADVSN